MLRGRGGGGVFDRYLPSYGGWTLDLVGEAVGSVVGEPDQNFLYPFDLMFPFCSFKYFLHLFLTTHCS